MCKSTTVDDDDNEGADTQDTLTLSPVRMSKITNDGLTRSGTGSFFIAVPIWQQCASNG